LAQAEARALSRLLGREEGLEDPIHSFGVHTAPGVGNGNKDILSSRHWFRQSLDVGIVERCIAGFDGQPAPAGHRISGVYRKVQERVLKFARIGLRFPETRARNRLQRDCLSQGALQQVGHARH
jgi:hypothetical protein